MSGSKIKVMIVDDSVLIRKYVTQALKGIEDIEVIATAPNGKIALKKLYLYHPDVIILDIEMPEMNGLEFLRYLQKQPEKENVSIIILSSIVGKGNTITFEALSLGAQDFITKPQGNVKDNLDIIRTELELKIKALYSHDLKDINLKNDSTTSTQVIIDEDWKKTNTVYGIDKLPAIIKNKTITPKIIAVGSSTGGPHAIRKILQTLGTLPVPMIIAQHMPPGFTKEFANNLSNIYKREIKEAKAGEMLENGIIYICPGGYHTSLESREGEFIVHCQAEELEGFFFKPSVDIFLESILKMTDKHVLGVILSGMGKDGAKQAGLMRSKGALMFAQDKESSVVWGMPGNAVSNNGIDIILPIEKIGSAINQCIKEYFPKKTG